MRVRLICGSLWPILWFAVCLAVPRSALADDPPRSDEDCIRSEACKRHSECKLYQGECRVAATNDAKCAENIGYWARYNPCLGDGRCAARDADCRASGGCKALRKN